MTVPQVDLETLASDGIDALMDRLGPVRAIQFIRLCDSSIADYTAERHQWLAGMKLSGLVEQAKQRDAAGER